MIIQGIIFTNNTFTYTPSKAILKLLIKITLVYVYKLKEDFLFLIKFLKQNYVKFYINIKYVIRHYDERKSYSKSITKLIVQSTNSTNLPILYLKQYKIDK